MKPEQWIIDDIRWMRGIQERSTVQDNYLSLLTWYTKMLKEWSK